MGFFKKLKDKFTGTLDKLVGKAATQVLPEVARDIPPEVDTSRYVHVSVPLIPIEDANIRKLLKVNYLVGKGQSHIIGNNSMKRVADAVGKNNKQRRRIRSKMKRRAEELRAQAKAVA